MNEKKAKQLRYMLRSIGRTTPVWYFVDALQQFSEKQIRRQMILLGEQTTGTSLENTLQYAENTTENVKGTSKNKNKKWNVSHSKRQTTAFSLALTQVRGMIDHKYLMAHIESAVK